MDASNTMREITNSKVPAELKDNLTQAVTTDAVKRDMFSITGDKAVGHGFNAAFYHKNWNIVGSVVVETVQSFFAAVFFP